MSLFSHAEPVNEPDPDALTEQRIVATVGVHGGGLAGVLADGSLGDVMLGSLGQDDTYETEVVLDPAADAQLRAIVGALAERAGETGPGSGGEPRRGRVTTTARLELASGGEAPVARVRVLLGHLVVGVLDTDTAQIWTEVLADLAGRGARHVFAATALEWDADRGDPAGDPGIPVAVRLDLVADDEYADDVIVDAREILDDPLSELGRS